MKRRDLAGSFWPSPQEDLLLRAALLRDDRADAAWRELAPRVDIERLEPGVSVLLPLLYRQLRERAGEEALLSRLRGVYRYTWYANQLDISTLVDVLAVLEGQGIPTILLGPAALVGRYYRDLGLRRVGEPRVLVGVEDRDRALEAFTRDGRWTSPARSPARRQRLDGGGNGGRSFVLQWRLGPELEAIEDVRLRDELWHSSVAVGYRGMRGRALSASDELFVTCVDGARNSALSRVQWIADAATIVQTAESEVDWDRLINRAVATRLVPRLRDALHYLRETLELPIPGEVLQALAAAPTTKRELLAHRLSGRGGPLLGNLPSLIGAHIVATQDESTTRALSTLPGFVRDEWGLERISHVPAEAVRRLASTGAQIRKRRSHRRR